MSIARLAAAGLLLSAGLGLPTSTGAKPDAGDDRIGTIPATIHEIQGSGLLSPLAGSEVVVEGVVTATLDYGYFIQSPDNATDSLPETSEGLYVNHWDPNQPRLYRGNRVRIYGRVEEARTGDYPHQMTVTQLVDVTGEYVLESSVPLPAPVLLTPDALSADADPTALEHLEGMRVRADELLVVGASPAGIDPVDQSLAQSGVFHAVLGTSVTGDALPFRQPGLPPFTAEPLPAGKSLPFHNGNPQVLAIDGNSQRGDTNHDFDLGFNDRVRNVVGVLDYWRRYRVLVDQDAAVSIETGIRGEGAFFLSAGEVKLVWMDLGGLYDASDDPLRDEPVHSPAVYQARLSKIATGLCNFLANPEVIAVGGVENVQVLEDLAALVETNPTTYCPWPRQYEAVLVEGSDDSGLDLGFLVAGYVVDGLNPRVQVLEAGTFASTDTVLDPYGASKPMFVRPPLAARLRLTDEGGRQVEFTAVNVSLREESESDFGMSVRAGQAARIASWIETRQQADPDEAIAVLGGFEADQFNDGRVDVMGILTGRPAPAEETWVAVPSPVTTPLDNLTDLAPAYTRYTANDQGEFRALDHILVNGPMRRRFAITSAHPRMNADFPASARAAGDPGFTFSARDPLMARLAVAAFIDANTRVEIYSQGTFSPRVDNIFYVGVTNQGPDPAPSLELVIESSLTPAQWSLSTEWPGWTCGAVEAAAGGSRVACNNPRMIESHGFQIHVPADLSLDGGNATFTATLRGGHNDPDLSDNTSTRVFSFDGRVDVNVELMPINGTEDLIPGDPGGWVVIVNRAPLNPPGPVTITLDVDAVASDVTLNLSNDYVTCDAGVAIAPGRSRFTCTAVNDDFLQVAVFSLSFRTGLLDGGRVVGLRAEAQASGTDPTPDDNVATASRRVSDRTDLVVAPPSASPEVTTLDGQPSVYFSVSNAIRGVARNARLEILVDLPPAAVGEALPMVFGQTPSIWTCLPPAADGAGSRIACATTSPMVQPEFPSYTYGFMLRFTPPYRDGLDSYTVTTRVIASSESEEQAPADNASETQFIVDQTSDLALLNLRTLVDPVREPQQALFDFRVESMGPNSPRNPRVRLELNALFDAGDIEVRSPFGQVLACATDAAPVGHTAIVCPAMPGQPSSAVYVRTRPDLVGRQLTLDVSVGNDLPDSVVDNNRGEAITRVVSQPDLCVGSCGQPLPRPLPMRLLPDQVNTLVYETMNLGPSTAPDSVASVRVPLPASRLSASFQSRACAPAADIGGGRSEVRCAMGDLAGDRMLRLLSVVMDLSGITSGDFPIEVQLETPLPGDGSGNHLLRMTLPVATVVDLSATVSAKATRFPGAAQFAVETRQSRAHTGQNWLLLRIESPGAASVSSLVMDGPGWSCWQNQFLPDLQEWQCQRYLPLTEGSRIAVEVPAHAFMQIGRPIRVTARHYFVDDSLSVDLNPANNEATATHVVVGRRTQSEDGEEKPTPAYGVRRAPAPAATRAPSRRAATR